MASSILNTEFRPEQRERITSLVEHLNKHWVPITSMTRSSGGVFGTFANVPLSMDDIWTSVRAEVLSNYLVPRQTGGKPEVAHVNGELPFHVQFMAKVWPSIVAGHHNIEVNLYPALRPEDRDIVRLEQLYMTFDEMLGKDMQRPGVLVEFVRRQLERAGGKRSERAAEIAEMLAQELREAKT